METEAFETTTPDTEYQTVRREVALFFFRHQFRCDSITIKRYGADGNVRTIHKYDNPNNVRYNEINRIIHKHHIPLEVDLYAFTDIVFYADKEEPIMKGQN